MFFNSGVIVSSIETDLRKFYGLNNKSKEFIRKNCVWVPLTRDLSLHKKNIIYYSLFIDDKSGEPENVSMFFEGNEILMGTIKSILFNETTGRPLGLNRYLLCDGGYVEEVEQLTIKETEFLCLLLDDGTVVGEWTDEEIKTIID